MEMVTVHLITNVFIFTYCTKFKVLDHQQTIAQSITPTLFNLKSIIKHHIYDICIVLNYFSPGFAKD